MFAMDLLMVCVIAAIILLIYHYVTKQYESRNSIAIKSLSFFGFCSAGNIMLRNMDRNSVALKLYNDFPNAKIVGTWNDTTEVTYLLRNPDMIKKIVEEDFEYFMYHTPNMSIANAEDQNREGHLFAHSLFALRDQKWRDMRATLSLAFTGSKMRHMFELVAECGQSIVEFFTSEAKAGKTLKYEMKDVFSRFGNDFVDKRTTDYLKNMIVDDMTEREGRGIVRNDMINMLMQIRKGALKQQMKDAGSATVKESQFGKSTHTRWWTENELKAQCFLFFLAGFDIVSSCITFLTYELTVNPNIQKRLYKEVLKTFQSLNGKPLTYDALHKMKYMDMVVSESLRMWPPTVVSEWFCVKGYLYDDGAGQPIRFNDRQNVWIPTFAIHRDGKYYHNPNQFDSERFNEKNRSRVTPAAYLPFGMGPPNCIGSRFTLMQIKSIIYYLLKDFSLEPTEKTQIPLRLTKTGFSLPSEKGVWLELKPRK